VSGPRGQALLEASAQESERAKVVWTPWFGIGVGTVKCTIIASPTHSSHPQSPILEPTIRLSNAWCLVPYSFVLYGECRECALLSFNAPAPYDGTHSTHNPQRRKNFVSNAFAHSLHPPLALPPCPALSALTRLIRHSRPPSFCPPRSALTRPIIADPDPPPAPPEEIDYLKVVCEVYTRAGGSPLPTGCTS
jgi:hypothetical protein